MFYEFNLLLHVGVVAERVRAAAAARRRHTKGTTIPPSRGVKTAVVTPIIMEQPSS